MTTTYNDQAVSSGIFAMIAGMAAAFIICVLVLYILLIIAEWKIFTKAGEAGWKSLIPIYNVYVLFKITGVKMYWFIGLFVVAILGGIISAINVSWLTTVWSIIQFVFYIALYIIQDIKLSNSFGKGTGFKVANFFFPNICMLILGFGSAKYVGPDDK